MCISAVVKKWQEGHEWEKLIHVELWDTVTIRDLYAKAEEDRKAVKGRNTWRKTVAEQKEKGLRKHEFVPTSVKSVIMQGARQLLET